MADISIDVTTAGRWDVQVSSTLEYGGGLTIEVLAVAMDDEEFIRRVSNVDALTSDDTELSADGFAEAVFPGSFADLRLMLLHGRIDEYRVNFEAKRLPDATLRQFVQAFVVSHPLITMGIARDVDALSQLIAAVERLPFPVFGSPPSDWRTLAQQFSGSAIGIGAFGISTVNGRPLLMVLSAGGMFAVWFTAPLLRLLRESAAQRLAEKLNIQLRGDHLD